MPRFAVSCPWFATVVIESLTARPFTEADRAADPDAGAGATAGTSALEIWRARFAAAIAELGKRYDPDEVTVAELVTHRTGEEIAHAAAVAAGLEGDPAPDPALELVAKLHGVVNGQVVNGRGLAVGQLKVERTGQ